MDDLLQKLVAWLESASPHLWAILVRQVQINAIRDGMVVFILFSGVLGVGLFLKRKWAALMEEKASYWVDEDELRGWIIGYGIASAVLLAVCLANLYSIIGAVLNPEYQAIMLILNQLKDK